MVANNAVSGLNDFNGAASGLPRQRGSAGDTGYCVLALSSSGLAASFILLKLVGFVFPLRASEADERDGMDVSMHGEEAYVHGSGN